MTEKDTQLISQANLMGYNRWDEIDSLIEMADSPEAKEELKRIAVYKYHLYEASCGCL